MPARPSPSLAPSSTASSPGIAVVVPCYRVRDRILEVLERVPPEVRWVICVDDACPEGSAAAIEEGCDDPRVRVLRNEVNLGVGGAVVRGYREALALGAEVVVKVDGDGQMDPALIPMFVAAIERGICDYAKGNRFTRPETVQGMPAARLVGNALLSFFSKLSTGYWNVFDPTNGYTAIHAQVLRLLPLDKISRRYFFESDMLFRLSTVSAVVADMPIEARYAGERSSLRIARVVVPFALGHLRNMLKRFVYSYLVRDFNVASVELLLAPPLLLFGIVFGLWQWSLSQETGIVASAGTVMLAAMPILVGLQMLLSAFNYDVNNVPRVPLHTLLLDVAPDRRESPPADARGGEPTR